MATFNNVDGVDLHIAEMLDRSRRCLRSVAKRGELIETLGAFLGGAKERASGSLYRCSRCAATMLAYALTVGTSGILVQLIW